MFSSFYSASAVPVVVVAAAAGYCAVGVAGCVVAVDCCDYDGAVVAPLVVVLVVPALDIGAAKVVGACGAQRPTIVCNRY